LDDINRDASQIDQKKLLLDSIFSHRLDYIKDYFRSKDETFSFRRDILYSKLNEGIDDGTFSLSELTKLLDKIEEYGNQHIYLYNCNEQFIKILKDPNYIKEKLKKFNLENIYNGENCIILPNEPTLTSVIHNGSILKFKWVEKRVWKDPLDEMIEDDIFVKRYQINLSRGITTFRINLVSNEAEIMIQRLPRGANYEKIRDNYLDEVSHYIDIYSLTHLGLRRAIRRLEDSDEVDKRLIDLETIEGGRVAFKSKDSRSDYRSDSNLCRSRTALGYNVSGNKGSFYWKANHILERPILTHIYANDNRMGIFGQRIESEVNYVLSRVRYFASHES